MKHKIAAGFAALTLITSGIAVIPAVRAQEKMTEMSVPKMRSAKAPKKAIVLFSGKADEIKNNWYSRYTMDSAGWTVDAEGIATPNKHDITSKQEFGDAYIHVEFRTPVDGGGNAGVGIQGRYEIQIFNSFGKEPESHGAGALYSQKPAMVEASKKPGEWQMYDIIFHAPKFGADGKVTEMPRATVYQNGTLVQKEAQFTGMTGIQYGQYKEMTPKGPLVLQGDHDVVQYRNVWVLPLR